MSFVYLIEGCRDHLVEVAVDGGAIGSIALRNRGIDHDNLKLHAVQGYILSISIIYTPNAVSNKV